MKVALPAPPSALVTCRACRQGKGICRHWNHPGHLSDGGPPQVAKGVRQTKPSSSSAASASSSSSSSSSKNTAVLLAPGSTVEAQWPADVAAFKKVALDTAQCTWYRATVKQLAGRNCSLEYADDVGSTHSVPVAMVRALTAVSAMSPATSPLASPLNPARKTAGHDPTPSGSGRASSSARKAPLKQPAGVPGATRTNQGPWSDEEHGRLVRLVEKHGARDWPPKAEALGTGRTSKAVECRWRRHAELPEHAAADASTTKNKKKQKTSPALLSKGEATERPDSAKISVLSKSTKFARIQDGDVSRAVTKSGRVHLSRYQATAAGIVIQPEFDPKRDWEPDERQELIDAVNAAFHRQQLPQIYSSQNLDSWRKNAAYKWAIQQRGYVPPSWGGDHRQLGEQLAAGRVVSSPRPVDDKEHGRFAKLKRPRHDGQVGGGQKRPADAGAAAAAAPSSVEQRGGPITGFSALPAASAAAASAPVKLTKTGKQRLNRAQTVAAGSIVQGYWDSGVLARKNERQWQRICDEVNDVFLSAGMLPIYTYHNLNSWYRNVTYKQTCRERDYNPPSWGGAKISDLTSPRSNAVGGTGASASIVIHRGPQGFGIEVEADGLITGFTGIDTPAELAGVALGSRITGVENTPVTTREEILAILGSTRNTDVVFEFDGGVDGSVANGEALNWAVVAGCRGAVAQQQADLEREIEDAVHEVVSELVDDVEQKGVQVNYFEDARLYNLNLKVHQQQAQELAATQMQEQMQQQVEQLHASERQAEAERAEAQAKDAADAAAAEAAAAAEEQRLAEKAAAESAAKEKSEAAEVAGISEQRLLPVMPIFALGSGGATVKWSEEELNRLRLAVAAAGKTGLLGGVEWEQVSKQVGRTPSACSTRAIHLGLKPGELSAKPTASASSTSSDKGVTSSGNIACRSCRLGRGKCRHWNHPGHLSNSGPTQIGSNMLTSKKRPAQKRVAFPTFADLKNGMRCDTAWTDEVSGVTTWSRATVIDCQPESEQSFGVLLLWYPDTKEEEALRQEDWVNGSVRDAYLPVDSVENGPAVWTQSTGVYLLESVEGATRLHARIAKLAEKNREAEDIANGILTAMFGAAISGEPVVAVAQFSNERKAYAAQQINEELKERGCVDNCTVARVGTWVSQAVHDAILRVAAEWKLTVRAQPDCVVERKRKLPRAAAIEEEEEEEDEPAAKHQKDASLFDLAAAMLDHESEDDAVVGEVDAQAEAMAAAEARADTRRQQSEDADAEQLLYELSSPRSDEEQNDNGTASGAEAELLRSLTSLAHRIAPAFRQQEQQEFGSEAHSFPPEKLHRSNHPPSSGRYYDPEDVLVPQLYERALAFVGKVQTAYAAKPRVAEDVLKVLTDFQLQTVSRQGVMEQMSRLFTGPTGGRLLGDFYQFFEEGVVAVEAAHQQASSN